MTEPETEDEPTTAPGVTRSYRPGSWYAVLGTRATVLLPPSEQARVAAIWALVDDGAGFDVTLDALLSGGLRDLAGFVLIATEGDTTQVVLRGSVSATFATGTGTGTGTGAGSVELTGDPGSTWVERSLTGVTGVTVTVEADPGEATEYVVDGGLVRLARLDAPPHITSALETEAAPAAEPEPDPVPDPAPAARPEVAPDEEPVEPAPDPDDLLGNQPEPVPPPPTGAEDALADPSDADPSDADPSDADPSDADPNDPDPVEHAPAPDQQPEDRMTEVMAVLPPLPDVLPSVPPPPLLPPPPVMPPGPPGPPPSWSPTASPAPPASPAWPPAEPAPAEPSAAAGSDSAAVDPPDDHDGLTHAGGWQPDDFARPTPGIPGQPPAPSVTARPVARLHVSTTGETVDVDRVVVVGRAPEGRRFTATDQPRLVTVESPHQEISSTHLEVRPGSGADHGSAVVTDLGSTNGTVLVQPGLGPEELPPGVAVQLVAGAVLDLGDGVTISVTNP